MPSRSDAVPEVPAAPCHTAVGSPAVKPGTYAPARAWVNLDAVAHNVRVMAELAAGAEVMAMVKADGYGHGLVPCGITAARAGANWLGVAQLSEAFALRSGLDEHGLHPGILAGVVAPGAPFAAAIEADIDVPVGSLWSLAEVETAARAVGTTAQIHLKIDTGMSRGGATQTQWESLAAAAARAQAAGTIAVRGLYSHFACADEPGHPSIAHQCEAFAAVLRVMERAGIRPALRHLSNSAAVLTGIDAQYDMVRPGIAIYGLSPNPGVVAVPELVPAMRVECDLALVKPVAAGASVSYGHTFTSTRSTTLGLLPIGYGDGVARASSPGAEVWVGGRRVPLVGRVCMDQCMVDLGPGAPEEAGQTVVLFGDGSQGEPTADEWAAASGTINYEVVTRLSPRVPRIYTGGVA